MSLSSKSGFTSRMGAKKRSRKSSLLTSLRKSGYKPPSSATSGRIRTGVPSGRRTWCSVNETSASVPSWQKGYHG